MLDLQKEYMVIWAIGEVLPLEVSAAAHERTHVHHKFLTWNGVDEIKQWREKRDDLYLELDGKLLGP